VAGVGARACGAPPVPRCRGAGRPARHGLRLGPGRAAAAEQRPLRGLHQPHPGAGEGRAVASPRPLGRGRGREPPSPSCGGRGEGLRAAAALPAPSGVASAVSSGFLSPERRVAWLGRAWPALCGPAPASAWAVSSLATSEACCVGADRFSFPSGRRCAVTDTEFSPSVGNLWCHQLLFFPAAPSSCHPAPGAARRFVLSHVRLCLGGNELRKSQHLENVHKS